MRPARAGLWAALALLAGCKRDPTPAPAASVSASSTSPAPPASAQSIERDERPATAVPGDASATTPTPGELSDVGPAGPATASAHGVVMITRADEVVVARFRGKDAKDGALEAVTSAAGEFRSFARGPAVAGEFAYWTSRGRLLRQRISGGAPETLADDARDGTRVSAAVVGAGKSARAIASYIARNGDVTAARVWIERIGTWTLTPDGAAATSASLAVSGNDVVALSLEGRTGMTPVHARVLELASGAPKLGEDVVTWVAGPAQSHTEIAGVASDSAGVWAFVPLERDITRFGLAELGVGIQPKMGTPVTWRAYPNGLDPAPVAAAPACGSAFVLYAVPAEARPRAPQELHLAAVGREGLAAPIVVARSRAFANVSIAGAPGGVLVAYVADRRTWATVLRCPST